MNLRMARIGMALLCLVAGPASAAVFVWTGAASSDWGNGNNWNTVGCSVDCYPHTTDDDAIIGDDESELEIELDDDYTIDDMTLTPYPGEVRFIMSTSPSTARELSCDSIVINGFADTYVWANVKVVARQTDTP